MTLENFVRRGQAAQKAVDAITGRGRASRVAVSSSLEGFTPRPGAAPGVCRVCGCTQERGCADGCSWITADLCSTCAYAIDVVAHWMENALRPARARLIREAKARSER